jgi:alanyl-tRNA synthetase
MDAPLRVVEIAGVDSCTCCGTHVATAAQLQAVKLLGTSSVRGNTRVAFVFGDRLLRLAATLLVNESKLTALLSCGRPQHAEV